MADESTSGERRSDIGQPESPSRHARGGDFYHAIVDSLPDMVFRTRDDGTIVDFVPGQEASPYVSPDEFLDKRVQDVLPPDVGQRSLTAVREALRTGEVQSFSYQLVEQGVARDYEARVIPVGDREVFSIVRDMTRQRAAEEELERTRILLSAVTESATAGAFVHTTDGLAYMNAAAGDITGYLLADLQEIGFTEIVHPDDKTMVTQRMASRFRGEPEPLRYEFKIIHKSGEERWVDCAIGGVVDFEGQPAIIGTALDITGRKRDEEALRLAREELERKIDAHTSTGGVYNLTFRELSVLHLIADGKQDREIANLLGISHRTVQTHVARILKKMNARSRTDASVTAHKEGIIR